VIELDSANDSHRIVHDSLVVEATNHDLSKDYIFDYGTKADVQVTIPWQLSKASSFSRQKDSTRLKFIVYKQDTLFQVNYIFIFRDFFVSFLFWDAAILFNGPSISGGGSSHSQWYSNSGSFSSQAL